MTGFWGALVATLAAQTVFFVYVGWRLHQSGRLETMMWRYPWLLSLMHVPSVLVAAAFQEWWIALAFGAAGLMSLGIVMNASRHWQEPDATKA